METISQRQLRNDNAEIMREVEAGRSYRVTRRGVPVAIIEPISGATDLACARPARTRLRFTDLPRVASTESTADILADLRGDR